MWLFAYTTFEQSKPLFSFGYKFDSTNVLVIWSRTSRFCDLVVRSLEMTIDAAVTVVVWLESCQQGWKKCQNQGNPTFAIPQGPPSRHVLSREDPFPAFAFPRRYPLKTKIGPFHLHRQLCWLWNCGTRVTLTHHIIACQRVLPLGNTKCV